MDHKKQGMGVLLAGALLLGGLAGCQSEPAADDVTYRLTGIRRDAPLVTVDGREVAAEDYLFWLSQSVSLQQQYGNLLEDADWEADLGGTTAAEYVKNDALQAVTYLAVVSNKAQEYGITLTEEEQADLDSQMSQMEESLAGTGATLQMALEAQGISEEGFRRLTEQNVYLVQDLYSKLNEDGELEPTDEAMDAFLEDQGIYRVKHILLSTRRETGETDEYGYPVYEDFSEEETAQVQQEAQALVDDLRAADDLEALFDQRMNERSDDTRDESGNLLYTEYTASSGQMVPEFEEASLALEVGELSEPVKSDYGYHIILRLDADTEDTRAQYPGYRFQQMTQEWIDAAEVTTDAAYDTIDPKNYSEQLSALAEELQAQAAAQATASPAASPETSSAQESAPQTTPDASAQPTPAA